MYEIAAYKFEIRTEKPVGPTSTKNGKENIVLLGYNTASSGDLVSVFQDNICVPPSRVKNPKRHSGTLVLCLYREECRR
jgi:hypothetical protein